jgi:hypothetical protein
MGLRKAVEKFKTENASIIQNLRFQKPSAGASGSSSIRGTYVVGWDGYKEVRQLSARTVNVAKLAHFFRMQIPETLFIC